METKKQILAFVLKKKTIRTADVVRFSKISRQAAAKHLRELVTSGKLLKEGSTRSAHYVPFSAKKAALLRVPGVVLIYRLRGLEEDRVFDELTHRMGLKRKLSSQAFRIIQYAFTEMLNNAIDHSRAARVKVTASLENGVFTFEVLDRGIGAFESVRKKFRLKNAFEAAEHLLKGKQTTAPERHSGQGIFFTSRIADRFMLKSAVLKLDVNNLVQDVALLDVPFSKGTKVAFSLRQRSRKDLKKLFDAYTDDDFVFDRTEVRIRLSKTTADYVSRSEARRLLFGLEKFKRIVIDFSKVRGVGQGFADEIFRVFCQAHPRIRIESAHMSPTIAFIINRARQEGLR